jgi:hypothetical protein
MAHQLRSCGIRPLHQTRSQLQHWEQLPVVVEECEQLISHLEECAEKAGELYKG